jgi:hypothetical protein
MSARMENHEWLLHCLHKVPVWKSVSVQEDQRPIVGPNGSYVLPVFFQAISGHSIIALMLWSASWKLEGLLPIDLTDKLHQRDRDCCIGELQSS